MKRHHMRIRAYPLAIWIVLAACAQGADTLPRYSLNAGQAITYESTANVVSARGQNSIGGKAVYRVLSRESDGSWRVAAVTTSMEIGSASGDQTELTLFDLWPDGSVKVEGTWPEFVATLPIDFPRLPPDKHSAVSGWSQSDPSGTETSFQLGEEPKPGLAGFTGIDHTVFDAVYLTARTTNYVFDPGKGLLVSQKSLFTQGYGDQSHGQISRTLAGVEPMPKGEAEKYSAEFTAFFEAAKAEQAALSATPPSIDAAGEILVKVRARTSLPQLRQLLDAQISQLASGEQWERQEEADRAAIVNHPAPDWQLEDLAGAKHSLADYRGKVVILDFWYRGCPWCIRAMPQVKQVAAEFASRPVAVLGMNTDRDPADAKWVVSSLSLNYPILRAGSQPGDYHVRGFPTLIIIDQQGTVRDMDVGYNPSLHDTVAAKVNALLAKP
jgi:peroxiredoxin